MTTYDFATDAIVSVQIQANSELEARERWEVFLQNLRFTPEWENLIPFHNTLGAKISLP